MAKAMDQRWETQSDLSTEFEWETHWDVPTESLKAIQTDSEKGRLSSGPQTGTSKERGSDRKTAHVTEQRKHLD